MRMHMAVAAVLVLVLALVGVRGAPASQLLSPVESPSNASALVCHHTAHVGVIECFEGGVLVEYENREAQVIAVGAPAWWADVGVVAALVLVAGLMSGLTIGLMGLDQTTLVILARSGTPTQRRYAKRLVPLLRQHHLLLVTLLLCNAAAMEALPVFLEHLVPPAVAIVVSVTLVLFFGEIIPQAVCARYALAIGYVCAYPVWALMALASPLAWPISKLLDFLLGSGHATRFRRQELRELVALHSGAELSSDEVALLRRALDLKTLTVGHVYTPLRDVTMLALDERLSLTVRQRLARAQHTRVLVYRGTRAKVVGAVHVAQVLGAGEDESAASLDLLRVPKIRADAPLSRLSTLLQRHKTPLALVLDPHDERAAPLGVAALSDVSDRLLFAHTAREEERGHSEAGEHADGSGERANDESRVELDSSEERVPELAEVYFGSDEESSDTELDDDGPR